MSSSDRHSSRPLVNLNMQNMIVRGTHGGNMQRAYTGSVKDLRFEETLQEVDGGIRYGSGQLSC